MRWPAQAAAVAGQLQAFRELFWSQCASSICELMFTRVMKARKLTVDVSALSQSLSTDTVSVIMTAYRR